MSQCKKCKQKPSQKYKFWMAVVYCEVLIQDKITL